MAIHIDRGITQQENIPNLDEFELFQKGEKCYIVADHTKIGNTNPWTVLENKQITNIITDSMSNQEKSLWNNLGVNIFIAE